MLRITETAESGTTVLRVEGKLVPPWVEELDSCCLHAISSGPGALIVDLRAVTYVSSEGKKLLGRMFRGGAKLLTSGTLMNGIVEEFKHEIDGREDSQNDSYRA